MVLVFYILYIKKVIDLKVMRVKVTLASDACKNDASKSYASKRRQHYLFDDPLLFGNANGILQGGASCNTVTILFNYFFCLGYNF